MLEMKSGDRGVFLLALVGYCGEFPVKFLGKAPGYYDYNRRLVTEMVREKYLKERKITGYDRRVIRSLSLTDKGLTKLKQLHPKAAKNISEHRLAPEDGQGDRKKTLRLHRHAACLLMAMMIGAAWKPGKAKMELLNRAPVYYGAYEIRKLYGMDNKGSRASGVLFGKYEFFPVYYLGQHNMQWSKESEKAFQDAVFYSAVSDSHVFGGNIFIGDDWSLTENLITNGKRGFSRLIPANDYGNFFLTFDGNGADMIRIILDHQKILALQSGIYRCQISERILERQLLFDLGYVSSLYAGTEEERRKGGVLAAGFFPFQMDAVKQINNTNSQLIEVPVSVLYEAAGFGPKQNADNGS